MRREGLQEFYLIPPIQPSVPLVVNRLAKDNDPSQHDGADKNTSIPFCGHLSRVAPLLFNLYMFNSSLYGINTLCWLKSTSVKVALKHDIQAVVGRACERS